MFVSTAYAAVSEHGEVAATSGAERHFPPFDFSFLGSHLFWLFLCFGIFYLLMARIVLPRIGGVIEMRHGKIAEDLDQAVRMKKESDVVIASYEKLLAEARTAAHSIAIAARNDARCKADSEQSHSDLLMEKEIAKAEEEIQNLRSKAMQDVQKIAKEIVPDILRQVAHRSVDPAQFDRFFQDYLAQNQENRP